MFTNLAVSTFAITIFFVFGVVPFFVYLLIRQRNSYRRLAEVKFDFSICDKVRREEKEKSKKAIENLEKKLKDAELKVANLEKHIKALQVVNTWE